MTPLRTLGLTRRRRSSPAARLGIAPAQARRWLAEARARAGTRQLHEADLMLARACVEGHEEAWEELWRRCRPRLRAAARVLTHDAASADELADGLLGDLFTGKLRSYQGLGSLEAWLCTLLAQAHVNRWRAQRRWVSLEIEGGLEQSARLGSLLSQPHPEYASPSADEQEGLDAAVASVLQALATPARLLLSWYFLDGRTLAEVGRLLGVHESTVSRRLDRLLGQLRRQTKCELSRRGLAPAATAAALHIDPRRLQVDVRQALAAPGSRSGPRGAHGL